MIIFFIIELKPKQPQSTNSSALLATNFNVHGQNKATNKHVHVVQYLTGYSKELLA